MIYKNEFLIAELLSMSLTIMDNHIWKFIQSNNQATGYVGRIPLPAESCKQIERLFAADVLFQPTNGEEYHMYGIYFGMHNWFDMSKMYYKQAIKCGHNPSIHNLSHSVKQLCKKKKYIKLCLSNTYCKDCTTALNHITNIETNLRAVDKDGNNISNKCILSLIRSYSYFRCNTKEVKCWIKIGVTRRIPECAIQLADYYNKKGKILKAEKLLEFGLDWGGNGTMGNLISHYITNKRNHKLYAIIKKLGYNYDNNTNVILKYCVLDYIFRELSDKTYEHEWLYLAKIIYEYKLSKFISGVNIVEYYAEKEDVRNMFRYSEGHSCKEINCPINILFNKYLHNKEYEKIIVEHDSIYTSCEIAKYKLASSYYYGGNPSLAINICKGLMNTSSFITFNNIYKLLVSEVKNNPNILIYYG
jgi:hypothetical protein